MLFSNLYTLSFQNMHKNGYRSNKKSIYFRYVTSLKIEHSIIFFFN